VLQRFEGIEFTVEYKYDGFRGQIHYFREGDTHHCLIYSRNLENLSKAYPDVIENIKDIVKQLDVDNFIIDSELVAFDVEKQKILPFQTLS
jgi:DNA ligase 1